MSRIVTGLDLGSSFVRAVIGEVDESGNIEIIGSAKRNSTGLRNGVIVNKQSTKDCIKSVIEDAEQKAGYEVTSCVTGVGGVQIESMDSKGLVAVSSHGKSDREITQDDINRVLDAANALTTPMDRSLLHIIPKDYIIDGQSGYKNPLNTIAVRLEAEVHIITASSTAIKNITSCVEEAGYQLDRIMLKTLACTEAVMGEEERELGSILIDLGGGTTDVLVIIKDAPVCTVSIPVGGNFVTNDIAVVKGVSISTAEKIKIENGCCWLPLADNNSEVIIPGVGGKDPELTSQVELCQIIQPRMEEIFTMVRDEVIRRSNLNQLSGNIILTGGGALMSGVVETAENIFGTSAVRLGTCPSLGSAFEEEYKSPDYATAVGLVIANKNILEGKIGKKEKKRHDSEKSERESTWAKIKKLFF